MSMQTIREGEKFYYLTVPDENDWSKIDVKLNTGKTKLYSENKLEGYYVSRSERSLLLLAFQIKLLFISPSMFKQASEKDKTAYHVYVSNASNVCDISFGECKGNITDQKRFLNNCFRYKKDAKIVANRICDILGLPHVKEKKA